MRREAELPERGAVGALAALMRGQQIVGDARGERLRDEGGGAAVEAVEDGDGVVRGRAEHDARNRAELEAADLGEHVEPVARVGRIDREGARDDADLLPEALVGDVRAASRGLLGREIAERRGDAGARRRIGDAHLAGQETGVALRGDGGGDLDARLDGAARLVARHRGALGHVLRAARDLVVDDPRDAAGISGDAEVDDEEVGGGVGGEGICCGAL